MAGHAVTHFEIVGADSDGLQAFYAAAFGWEMQSSVPGYAMAIAGDGGIDGGVGCVG